MAAEEAVKLAAPTTKRRWLQFGLRSFLAAVAVCALAMPRCARWLEEYFQEQATAVPITWDLKSGANLKWSARLGSCTYGSPVVAGGKVFIGTNNGGGRLKDLPPTVDLGVLLCFRESDGKFLWQASSEKLPEGEPHDWPLTGVCSTPLVQSDRLWYVTNRCEVVCLDTEGFRDQEDDGPDHEFVRHASQPGGLAMDRADVVWKFDMRGALGVQPHNMSNCSVASDGTRLFVCTSNGVNATHDHIPAPDAPSFLALDQRTGKLLWTDNSPGENILHGQWGSPAYAVLGGVRQVLFPGGDGWLYSFDPRGTPDGKAALLWKFDCNPKDAGYSVGGRSTRNHLIATPAMYEGLVYMAVGEDPEHGEGDGHLWCIDPTRRGDVSPELVYNRADPTKPIPPRRLLSCDRQAGDFTRPNPNSAAVWHFDRQDVNGDGKIAFDEEMHRSLSKAVIRNGLLLINDLSGIVHCLDAKTGRQHWSCDLMAPTWTSPLIAGQHVYVTDEDGDVAVFRLSADPAVAMAKGAALAEINASTSFYATCTVANNVLYLPTRNVLYAIEEGANATFLGPSAKAKARR